MPRETCIADPVLLWLLTASNLAIAVAYAAIPLGLWNIHRRVPTAPFPKLGYLFMAFIACCGGTHVLSAAVIFWPVYRAEALLCIATAAVSLAAAILLLRLRLPIVRAAQDYLGLVKDIEAQGRAR